MAEVDTPYTFGNALDHLSAHEALKLSAVKSKIKATIERWEAVPIVLRPIAEDLSTITPQWLQPPTTSQTINLMND